MAEGEGVEAPQIHSNFPRNFCLTREPLVPPHPLQKTSTSTSEEEEKNKN